MDDIHALSAGATLAGEAGGTETPPASFFPTQIITSGNENPSTVSLLADAVASENVDAIRYNKDGTVRRKPGRKLGVTSAAASPGQSVPENKRVTAAKNAQVKLTAEQTSRLLLNTTVGMLVQLIGPEWDFVSQDEADGMRAATTAYIEAKGGVQMSPEVCLLLAVSGYALSRVQHENTQTKLTRFFGSAWSAIKGVFSR